MRTRICGYSLMLLLGLTGFANAQPAPYPPPKSVQQLLYANKADEIALARSAAPASISGAAEILTLGAHGYETAVKGKNGFVCFVDRSWSKPFEDPEFWNPKVRAPQCANDVAARSVLPIFLQRTRWVMAGLTKDQIADRTRAALGTKTLPVPQPGTAVYMMSKQGYIADSAAPHWHPHVMFYAPPTKDAAWGANLPGSPVMQAEDDSIALTTFFVLVSKWSDGTPAVMAMK
jgi:hypothetical protein